MDKPRKRGPGAGRKPQGATRKTKTSVAIDPELLAEIDAKAAQLGIARNAAIETALRLWAKEG